MTSITSGIADFIFMPLEQYQRDGRILKGFQKGAKSIQHTTSLALNVGHHFAKGTRSLLER